MDWEEEYKRKLVSPEEAVKLVKSGDMVALGMAINIPPTLCHALGKRKDELEGVRITQSICAAFLPWLEPGYEKAFNVIVRLFTGLDRHLEEEGRCDVLHMATSLMEKQDEEERKGRGVDVYMGRVGPPDKHGYCSFGQMVWWSKSMARRAKVVLAEVVPDQIRTYGENYIHVSEIDRFVEHSPPPLPPQFADLDLAGLLNKFGMVLTDEEEARIAEVIGETIAADIIRDGDCIQVGGGSVSGTMCAFLHNKHDLGIHSEVIPGGTADLVKEGVITGNRKSINRGKVVGTALSGLSPEELGFFNENPVLELYDITKINHPRVISQNDNVVAINNALSIDLTGQVNAASFGTRMFTSAGGQPDFLMGALWSHGGRAITVLPATGKKGTVSRIVPILEPGTEVAVSRYFVDHVVTEYGIAKLFGKTRKERVEELIAVAHPDFRAELRKEAQKLSWI